MQCHWPTEKNWEAISSMVGYHCLGQDLKLEKDMGNGDDHGKKEGRENVRMSAMAVGGVKSEIMKIPNPSDTGPTLCTHCQRTSNPPGSWKNLNKQPGNMNWNVNEEWQIQIHVKTNMYKFKLKCKQTQERFCFWQFYVPIICIYDPVFFWPQMVKRTSDEQCFSIET